MKFHDDLTDFGKGYKRKYFIKLLFFYLQRDNILKTPKVWNEVHGHIHSNILQTEREFITLMRLASAEYFHELASLEVIIHAF